MNNRVLYILFFISIIFTSCIPTKDMVYMQDKGNNNKTVVDESVYKPYRLQSNDILSINIKTIDAELATIFSNTTSQNVAQTADNIYFNGYTVDDHGNIRIPIIGEINVLGFTVEEVRKKIEKKLLDEYFKKEDKFFVNVKLGGFRYTINGEVGSPGTKTLFMEKLNILEAIANSGDITITGDRKDVKVIRQFPQGSETFSIDLTDASSSKSPVFYLQPNDYIYVKPLKQKSWGTGKTGIESLGTIITILSLATTTFLLLKN
ncbi:polysaccharide biosynthesis/export family protein [Flavobacterium sp.]|uniref:polysaccharide biosynthesis/export family protein n=1 Tax=Flavobacterium sp. TaxID=239 RepID=UPI002602B9A9|nr:polysaccharide biosynthesis/export family protein [Flavobacterium sp.]